MKGQKKLHQVIGVVLALYLLFLPVRPSLAQSSIQVLENEVSLSFPEGLQFHLSIENDWEIESIVLIYGANGRTCQASSARQPLDFEPATELDLVWDWEWIRSGILPPGTQVWWQWEITDLSGENYTLPKKTIVVQDQRHSWESVTRDNVTVQWYLGEEYFGQKLLTIATESLDWMESEMSLQFSEPIHITVYPSDEDVREALLVTMEWTGGVAFPDYNSMIIGVGLTELGWAERVIPHEMNHLVVHALVFNCLGVRLPTWLSEGLAELSEGPLTDEQLDPVVSALEEGQLPPLNTLAEGFSAYGESAHLSYVQSKAVVHFLIENFNPQKLANLLAVMQAGDPIDPALEQIYGLDTQTLDAAWRASLGFAAAPDSPPDDLSRPTPTLVPTLAPIAPLFQPTATQTDTSTPEQPSPTTPPTAIALAPTATATPGSFPTHSAEATPQAESQSSATLITITSALLGLSLAVLLFLYIRKVRRN